MFKKLKEKGQNYQDQDFSKLLQAVLQPQQRENLPLKVANLHRDLKWVDLKSMDQQFTLFGGHQTKIVEKSFPFTNSNLTSLFGLLASCPSALRHIFGEQDLHIDQNGTFLNLFQNGFAKEILVDLNLPVLNKTFSSFLVSSDESELWPQLLLKGLAKLHGRYEALQNIKLSELSLSVFGAAPVDLKSYVKLGNISEFTRLIQ